MISSTIQQERSFTSSLGEQVGIHPWTKLWFYDSNPPFFSLQLSLCHTTVVFDQYFRSEGRMFIHKTLLYYVGECKHRRNRPRLVWSSLCFPNTQKNVERLASSWSVRPMAESVPGLLSRNTSLNPWISFSSIWFRAITDWNMHYFRIRPKLCTVTSKSWTIRSPLIGWKSFNLTKRTRREVRALFHRIDPHEYPGGARYLMAIGNDFVAKFYRLSISGHEIFLRELGVAVRTVWGICPLQ